MLTGLFYRPANTLAAWTISGYSHWMAGRSGQGAVMEKAWTQKESIITIAMHETNMRERIPRFSYFILRTP